MLIGNAWPNSAPAKTFTAADGRTMTVEVHEFGLLISDEGGATQVPHVEEAKDANGVVIPDVILVAGRPFRRLPG